MRKTGLIIAVLVSMTSLAQAKDVTAQQVGLEYARENLEKAESDYKEARQRVADSEKQLADAEKRVAEDRQKAATSRKNLDEASAKHVRAQQLLDQAWKQP
jgi:predicted  nucleic acid-binding Zn-ribbon protein